MTDLTTMTLAEARDALKAKKLSAVDLTKAHLAAMEQARLWFAKGFNMELGVNL